MPLVQTVKDPNVHESGKYQIPLQEKKKKKEDPGFSGNLKDSYMDQEGAQTHRRLGQFDRNEQRNRGLAGSQGQVTACESQPS